jgi:hypothetical protein
LQLPAFLLTLDSIRSVRLAAVTTSAACALSAHSKTANDSPPTLPLERKQGVGSRHGVSRCRIPPGAEACRPGHGAVVSAEFSWKQVCDSLTGRARLSRNVAAGLVGSAVAAGTLVPMQIPCLPRTARRFRVSSYAVTRSTMTTAAARAGEGARHPRGCRLAGSSGKSTREPAPVRGRLALGKRRGQRPVAGRTLGCPAGQPGDGSGDAPRGREDSSGVPKGP